MTFPDPNLGRPVGRPLSDPEPAPENTQDVVPPTERNKDPYRAESIEGATLDGSRPLTEDERKAADRDTPAGERVYAPASERVPKAPVPGHRDMVEHPDTHTPEREAAAHTTPMGGEPAFARVARPSTMTETPTPGAYGSSMSNPAFRTSEESGTRRSRAPLFMGLGVSWFTVVFASVGIWLYMRWQRERNKPINRLRRQALFAATQIRERMPNRDEAARPAMGVTTAMLTLLMVLWQQSRRQPRATDAVSDADWQQRLQHLKERWTPRRVELEKVSISRH
jgi:hypothetical protein